MQAINRILVTTDFSETSQEVFLLARQVAEKFDAEITLLHVLDAHLPPQTFEPIGVSAMEFDEERMGRAASQLDAFAERLGD